MTVTTVSAQSWIFLQVMRPAKAQEAMAESFCPVPMDKGPRSIGPIQEQQRPKAQGLGIWPVITNAMWNDHITQENIRHTCGNHPFCTSNCSSDQGLRHLLRPALHHTRLVSQFSVRPRLKWKRALYSKPRSFTNMKLPRAKFALLKAKIFAFLFPNIQNNTFGTSLQAKIQDYQENIWAMGLTTKLVTFPISGTPLPHWPAHVMLSPRGQCILWKSLHFPSK